MLDPSFAALLRERLAYAVRDMTPIRPAWTRKAACRGWSTSLWFPERGDPDNGRTAKRICEACPVRAECDAFAHEFLEIGHGIWAGFNLRSRRRARRITGLN